MCSLMIPACTVLWYLHVLLGLISHPEGAITVAWSCASEASSMQEGCAEVAFGTHLHATVAPLHVTQC